MLPSEHLEVGFIEMKLHRHDHYLLVMLCTFSRWVEAFPTRTERASEVARCLLSKIIPTSIGLDNSPAFGANLV